MIHIEDYHALANLLLQPRCHRHLLYVGLSIWCIEHLWNIVRVLLLGYTDIYTDVSIADSVHSEDN